MQYACVQISSGFAEPFSLVLGRGGPLYVSEEEICWWPKKEACCLASQQRPYCTRVSYLVVYRSFFSLILVARDRVLALASVQLREREREAGSRDKVRKRLDSTRLRLVQHQHHISSARTAHATRRQRPLDFSVGFSGQENCI